MQLETSRMSCPWFVGRTEELQQLLVGLDAAMAGSPAAVLVGGDAGIGKSRLLAELSKRAAAVGATVLTGHCLDVSDGGAPYGPIHEVLASLDDHRPVAARPAEALPEALRELTADHPVVLVIEDLHWADRSTSDLVAVLAGGPGVAGVLLVATYRADDLRRGSRLRGVLAELERAERVRHLRLSRFGPADVAEQLRGILGVEPPDDVVRAVIERSDGNPFFVEELAAATGGDELRRGLHDLLLARVERLDGSTQRVVRAAAVGGRRLSHDLLAAVVDLPPDALDEALRAACSNHVLSVVGDGYEFRHALVHEAVIGDVMPGERVSLHHAFATAIDRAPNLADEGSVARLVHHWVEARRPDRALAAAVTAAADAEREYALPEALRYYEQALAAWDDVDRDVTDTPGVTRVDVIERAADVASRTGEFDRAAELIAIALSELDDDDDRARPAVLHERRGWCLLQRGRGPEALAAYEQAIAGVPAQPATAARARVLAASADALERMERPAEAARPAEEAVVAAIAAGSPGDEGHARHTLGVSLAAQGDAEAGVAELRHALEIAVVGGDLADAVGVHLHLWRQLAAVGRANEVLDIALADASRARSDGMPVLGGVLSAVAAGYCHQLGRWSEADALLTETDPARLDGAVQLVVGALLDADRGDVQRAGDRLETVRAATLGLRDGRIDGLLFRGLAERAWSRGHAAAVAGIVDEGLRRTTDPEMVARLALVGLRASDGADADVDHWLDALTELRAYADRRRLGPYAELRAAVATGDAEVSRLRGPADPELWAAATLSWDRLGFPLPAAYCRWRHGESALVAGAPRDAASEWFSTAMAVTTTLGARPLAAYIEQSARRARLPAVAGGAPEPSRREADDDDDFGITAREREVLQLLARGLTNRQIASALFISEKTARVHVSHLLTKLAVPTRGAAVDVAHRFGLVDDQPG